MVRGFKGVTVMAFAALFFVGCRSTGDKENENTSPISDSCMEKRLDMTNEWDKVFPQSNEVTHTKVTFHNRYGITLITRQNAAITPVRSTPTRDGT